MGKQDVCSSGATCARPAVAQGSPWHEDWSPRTPCLPSTVGTASLTDRVHCVHVIHKVSFPQVDGQLEAAHGGGRKGNRSVFAVELAISFQALGFVMGLVNAADNISDQASCLRVHVGIFLVSVLTGKPCSFIEAGTATVKPI